jgi:hypothetical protein
MRQNNNPRRSRHKGGNGTHNNTNSNNTNSNNNGGNMGAGNRRQVPLRNQSFDSNGPEVRIRGNAWQVYEKYVALARDANAAGDPVRAENLLQHAEHYFRMITAADQGQDQRQQRFSQHAGNGYNGYGEGGEEGGEGEQPEATVTRGQGGQQQPQHQNHMGNGRVNGEANGHAQPRDEAGAGQDEY